MTRKPQPDGTHVSKQSQLVNTVSQNCASTKKCTSIDKHVLTPANALDDHLRDVMLQGRTEK